MSTGDTDTARRKASALTHGVWRLHELRSLLRTPTEQNQFEFVQTHPLIRDLSHYEALVPNCFASEHQPATERTHEPSAP